MANKIVKIIGALILLGLIVFALMLKQSADEYNTNRENEAERNIFKLEK